MENSASTEKEKGAVLERVTNTLATPLAGFATFLYATWQLVVEQQLFLRTFLVERMGKRGVPKLPLGYGNVLALKTILLLQHLSNNPALLQDARRRTEQQMLRRLQDRSLARSSSAASRTALPPIITLRLL